MYNHKLKRNVALAIILVLGAFIVYGVLPFLSAILGALVLTVLFKPAYRRIVNKFGPSFSAIIIIIISLAVIIVPLFFLGKLLVAEVGIIARNQPVLNDVFHRIELLSGEKINIESSGERLSLTILSYLQSAISSFLGSVSKIMANLFIMYFVFYYLLASDRRIIESLKELIPFSKKNREKLIREFAIVTDYTIAGTGLIALIQAVIMSASFYAFGIKGAVLWGAVSFVLAFIPGGTALIWIPAAGILFLNQNYLASILMLLIGLLVVSNVDNVIRPLMARKYLKMHPLSVIAGIFIGVKFFGVVGVIVGPLMISYFFLILKMYKQEYSGKTVKKD